MVYCVAGGVALLVLEFSASPPSFLPGFVLHRLRKLRQMLHFECHILTVATGRALCYLFFGSLLLADAGSRARPRRRRLPRVRGPGDALRVAQRRRQAARAHAARGRGLAAQRLRLRF